MNQILTRYYRKKLPRCKIWKIKIFSGVEQLVARKAHNLEVAGSSPATATFKTILYNEKIQKSLNH